MNVLLLYPEFPDTFWSFKHALRFVRQRASMPPLGLLTVAALLPDEWNKRLVDVNARPLTSADLAWADYALISAMAVQKPSALELIARCRDAGIPIVAGGPLFTLEPDGWDGVDHLVLDEAEITLPMFLRDFEEGHARRVYTSADCDSDDASDLAPPDKSSALVEIQTRGDLHAIDGARAAMRSSNGEDHDVTRISSTEVSTGTRASISASADASAVPVGARAAMRSSNGEGQDDTRMFSTEVSTGTRASISASADADVVVDLQEVDAPVAGHAPALRADMRMSPAPLWELVRLEDYTSMAIQFSRGCPFDCEFCNVTTLLGHRPRVKSSGQIIRELDALYDMGWRGPVFFVDDNLIGNKRELMNDLLPALIEWRKGKKGITFNTEASINLADDPKLLEMMGQAGFIAVFVGIETPDDAALAECNKKQNVRRDLLADVRRIQRSGMEVQGGFIVGFDSDTPGIFQRQIDFIQQSGIVTAMVGMLQALPGTRLHERMKREGRLIGRGDGHHDGMTNLIPRMGLPALREGYRALMRHIYSPGPYYRRIRTFLRASGNPIYASGVQRGYVMALLRSMYRLGVLGPERFHYWRLLSWTLSHRPRLVPTAITLAIYGHHFRKTCEQLE